MGCSTIHELGGGKTRGPPLLQGGESDASVMPDTKGSWQGATPCGSSLAKLQSRCDDGERRTGPDAGKSTFSQENVDKMLADLGF
jgi:hypothetical protein